MASSQALSGSLSGRSFWGLAILLALTIQICAASAKFSEDEKDQQQQCMDKEDEIFNRLSFAITSLNKDLLDKSDWDCITKMRTAQWWFLSPQWFGIILNDDVGKESTPTRLMVMLATHGETMLSEDRKLTAIFSIYLFLWGFASRPQEGFTSKVTEKFFIEELNPRLKPWFQRSHQIFQPSPKLTVKRLGAEEKKTPAIRPHKTASEMRTGAEQIKWEEKKVAAKELMDIMQQITNAKEELAKRPWLSTALTRASNYLFKQFNLMPPPK